MRSPAAWRWRPPAYGYGVEAGRVRPGRRGTATQLSDTAAGSRRPGADRLI
jgi:hypothetical protein